MLRLRSLALATAAVGLAAAVSAPTWGVYLKRLGPVTYGMTVAEANRLPGVQLVRPPGFNDFAPCGYVAPVDSTLPIAFMTDGERIVRGDVYGEGIRTASGIGIGSSAREVREAYDEALWEQPHLYGDGPGDRLLMLLPNELEDAEYRVAFNVFDDTVRSFQAGLYPFVLYPEGCV